MHVAPGTELQTLLQQTENAGGIVTYRVTANPDVLLTGIDDPEGNHLELLVQR